MNNLFYFNNKLSAWDPKRRVFLEGPKAPESGEAQKKSPEAPELTDTQLRAMVQTVGQNTADVLSAALKDPDPNVKKLAMSALRDANASLISSGYQMNVTGEKVQVGPSQEIIARQEGSFQATIAELNSIIKKFNVQKIRAKGIDKARGDVEDASFNKQAELMKIIGKMIKGYPLLKENLTVLRDDSGERLDAIREDLVKQLAGLDLKKDADAEKANLIIESANSRINEVIEDAKQVVAHIQENETLIDESKDYEKGKTFIADKIKLNSAGVSEGQKAELQELQKHFDASYSMLTGNMPEMQQKRAVLVAATLDQINVINGKSDSLNYSDYTRKLVRYKGGSAEDKFDENPSQPSKFPEGEAHVLAASTALRSDLAGSIGMPLKTLAVGTKIEASGEEAVAVETGPGKSAVYEHVKLEMPDGTVVTGFIEAKAIQKPLLAKAGKAEGNKKV